MNLLEQAINETMARMEQSDQQALEWAMMHATAKWHVNGIDILPAAIERWKREGRWQPTPSVTLLDDMSSDTKK